MWNYRIVKEGNEISIKEVFYDADKKPIMYGPAHLTVDIEMEEPIENEALYIANILTYMADALNAPILNADDFKGRNEITDIVEEILKQPYLPTETMH
tara:strand:+ start:635 stop:928 length:294 start_codon:yes stop_codon:yes gene_type:complete